MAQSRTEAISSRVSLIRKDSLSSDLGGRMGSPRDEILSISPGTPRRFSPKQIDELYEGDWLFQNIINAVAEDAVREWIEIKSNKKGLAEAVINKLQELKVQLVVSEALRYERLYGDGLVAVGAREKGQIPLSEPIKVESLINIDYLNAVPGPDISTFETNTDVFSPDYGKVMAYVIKPTGNLPERRIHPSRLFHIQTRPRRRDVRGNPLITTLFTPLAIFGGGQWSVGQVLRALVFKIYQSADINSLQSEEDAKAYEVKLDRQWQTGSLALIGKDDTLTFSGMGSSTGGIEPMLKFLWDMISGAAKMPKSHILGQPQGTISGAQFDSLNYYARIASLQETYLRPVIEGIVELIIGSKEMGLGKIATKEWNLVFKPLWQLDSETDAKIRKMNAEIDQIYLNTGVRSPDEVAQERFGQAAVFDSAEDFSKVAIEAGLSGDEIRAIAEQVDEARREAGV